MIDHTFYKEFVLHIFKVFVLNIFLHFFEKEEDNVHEVKWLGRQGGPERS